MAKPWMHAEISVRRFGGKVEDYLAIHEFMDSSKLAIPDSRHRALTHHNFFIEQVLKRVFGASIRNSSGKTVSVQDIGEQHCLDDFGHRFIPTAQDYLQEMETKPWMNNGVGLPSSAKAFESTSNYVGKSERDKKKEKADPIGAPNQYPLAIEPPLDRAYLRARDGSIFDTEHCCIGQDVVMFMNPTQQKFFDSDEIKTEADTDMWMPGRLCYPREFTVRGFAVSISGDHAGEIDRSKLTFEIHGTTGLHRHLRASEFPLVSESEIRDKLAAFIVTDVRSKIPDNALPGQFVLALKENSGYGQPNQDDSKKIVPGEVFFVIARWADTKRTDKKIRITFAFCGAHHIPM